MSKFYFSRYIYLGAEFYGDRIDIFKAAKRKLERDGKLLCVVPDQVLEEKRFHLKDYIDEIKNEITFEINEIHIAEDNSQLICFSSNDELFADIQRKALEQNAALYFEPSFIVSGASPFVTSDDEEKCIGFLNLFLVGYGRKEGK